MTTTIVARAIFTAALVGGVALSSAAMAQDLTAEAMRGKPGGSGNPPPPPPSGTYYGWMSSELPAVWADGLLGQGATITVVDDFSSTSVFDGHLKTDASGNFIVETHRHGEWTYMESSLVAPGAAMRTDDFASSGPVKLSSGFNVLNLSYGMMAAAGYNNILWMKQESTILDYAFSGAALISKAAGNDGVAIGGVNADGLIDYLGRDLVGAQSALFVGALDFNGSTSTPAGLAYYSNFAGDDVTVQNQFLVVGVDRGAMGFAGTSFAAPAVAGYAAILSSKFPSATPTQIANQLLDTARTDTLIDLGAAGWDSADAAAYGQGEASILRAVAPGTVTLP